MLKRIGLRNFKSWRSIEAMRLASITGLFGTNSSGKSSILQVLLMMKQTVESPDRMQVLNLGGKDDRTMLGTFREMLFRGQEPFEFHLEWALPKPLRIRNPEEKNAVLFSGSEMSFHTRISANSQGRMQVEFLEYGYSGIRFSMTRKESTPGSFILRSDGGDFSFRRSKGRPWDLPEPVKCYGFPDQVRAYYQNASFLSDLVLAFEEQFDRIYYLGPLREYPKREYTWSGAQPADMGQRGERVVDALLASRQREPIGRGKGKRRFTVEEYVAYWLKELGLVEDFSVEEITPDSNLYRVWITQSPGVPRVLITDVGFGISQILPVLTICYYVPQGSTILLEQPEIHLHPSVQAGLADVFIDAVKHRGVQIILESHSEHLLRRLQRRLAEENINPDQLALYFVKMEKGESRLQNLEVDAYGNILNWPPNFFGDELGDLAAMTEAAMKRKISARSQV